LIYLGCDIEILEWVIASYDISIVRSMPRTIYLSQLLAHPDNQMKMALDSYYGSIGYIMNHRCIQNCRIIPNVYTTLEEREVFVSSLREMAVT